MLGKAKFVRASLVAVLIMLLSVVVASAQARPTIFAVDQNVIDSTVTVARATSADSVWIAIHADADGAPGDVLGTVRFDQGFGATIQVDLGDSEVAAGDVLHAVLHTDSGGEFDPAVDLPVEFEGGIVSSDFAVNEVGSSLLRTLADNDLSGLFELVETAGMAGELAEGGPYTIFAPSNAAFAAATVPADSVEAGTLLQGHIVPGILPSSEITVSQVITSLAGTPIDVVVADDGSITLNGIAVSGADVSAYNGVIHVIDGVLLPPAPEEEVAEEAAVEATEVVTTTEVVATEEVTATAEVTATEVMTEEVVAAATEAPAEEATPEATEEPAEEAAAVATEAPAEEAAATEEAPEELPATGAPASPVLPMMVAGLVLLGLALFAILFRRRAA